MTSYDTMIHDGIEVSIILATYNRASYLHRCIDSVMEQSFTNWELVVIDDGSTDDTFGIVNAYVERDSRVKYGKHSHRGVVQSKNAGMQASSGRYITFIDSDDTFEKDHIQTRLDYMHRHPVLDIIEGGVEMTEEIYMIDYFNRGRLIHIRECVLGATFFGKRHIFFALKGFQDTEYAYGEDTDFWMRAEQRFHTQKIDQPRTYWYTRAEDSITKTANHTSV
ncbi:MAG: glycosyltransferase family 2 protein [Chloroflexaceae bacterium]|nr:glycosyltransferase family 2 protein [Chloroflexaceae bacterium]